MLLRKNENFYFRMRKKKESFKFYNKIIRTKERKKKLTHQVA